MGIAQITGKMENYSAKNIWGGKNAVSKALWDGKSYGIISVTKYFIHGMAQNLV